MLYLPYMRTFSAGLRGIFCEVSCKGWITCTFEAPQRRVQKPSRQIQQQLKYIHPEQVSRPITPAASLGCTGTSQHMAKVQFQHPHGLLQSNALPTLPQQSMEFFNVFTEAEGEGCSGT